MNKPNARSNAPWGFKAVIVRPNGSTHIPVRHNFKTRDAAIAYAQKYITANSRKA
jgi:hypothetical protein